MNKFVNDILFKAYQHYIKCRKTYTYIIPDNINNNDLKELYAALKYIQKNGYAFVIVDNICIVVIRITSLGIEYAKNIN